MSLAVESVGAPAASGQPRYTTSSDLIPLPLTHYACGGSGAAQARRDPERCHPGQMEPAELIDVAAGCLNPTEQDDRTSGGVASAIVTLSGDVFLGVCIDTPCSMGFCAEHAAVAAMVTAGQFQLTQVVAVTRDHQTDTLAVLPPCGRCREFIYQIDRRNLDAEVVLGTDSLTTLGELLPVREARLVDALNG